MCDYKDVRHKNVDCCLITLNCINRTTHEKILSSTLLFNIYSLYVRNAACNGDVLIIVRKMSHHYTYVISVNIEKGAHVPF